MLNNRALSVGSMLGSSGFSLDAITPGENVIESFVLKSVGVDVNHASGVSNTGLNEISMRN
jgi:hypothetical protein